MPSFLHFCSKVCTTFLFQLFESRRWLVGQHQVELVEQLPRVRQVRCAPFLNHPSGNLTLRGSVDVCIEHFSKTQLAAQPYHDICNARQVWLCERPYTYLIMVTISRPPFPFRLGIRTQVYHSERPAGRIMKKPAGVIPQAVRILQFSCFQQELPVYSALCILMNSALLMLCM